DTLRLLDRVLGAAAHQGVVLGRLWMPAPNQTAAGTAARLGAETTIYTSGIRRIRELGSPAIVSAIDVIEADPRLAAYNATITRALDGEPVGQAGGARRGQGRAVFRGYTLRASQLEDVVASAAEALRAEAQDL